MPRRRQQIARPDDPDLIVDYRGVVLAPAIVFNRTIYVEFDLADGRYLANGEWTPVTVERAFVEFTLPYSTTAEAEFVALTAVLDQWATDRTNLRFVAAPNRRSAFHAPDGTYLDLPEAE